LTYSFESLMNEVLRARPDIKREEILAMVAERKKTVGAGFLTDQGALFLIAGELGVKLMQPTSTELALKDIFVGANDITMIARVGAVYPVSDFKKKDGTTGRYRRLTLFDQTGSTKLTIWDDNPEAMKLDGVSVDSPVRVVNGYVRQGLDGRPTLSLGRRGRIELVQEESKSRALTTVAERRKKVADIGGEQELIALEGRAVTDSRTSNFTRQDGSSGSLTQFDIEGEKGEKLRVVIWNAVAIAVKAGQIILVTNLRVKRGKNGEREIHGDNASQVRSLSASHGQPERRFSKVNTLKVPYEKYDIEAMVLSPPILREIQLGDGKSVQKGEVVLGDDTGEITVIGWRDQAEMVGGTEVGEKVRIVNAVLRPSRMSAPTLELEGASRIEKAQV